LTGIYAIAHYPDISPAPEWIAAVQENARARDVVLGWLDRHPVSDSARAPVALEVGCGPGRFTAELAGRFSQGAVGLDIRLSMLRLARHLTAGQPVTVPFRTEGSRFEDVRIESSGPAPAPVHLIQADAIAPPFEAEIFPLVASLSVLDSMDDPVIFLGQIDALIAPGGLLLLAQPWQWEPTVTPPDAWWSGRDGTGPEVLHAALSGRSPRLPHLSYEVLEETDGLPWNLPGHQRLLYRYSLHAILARKQTAAS
jgi:SAM-dependent methyltransferase